MILIVQSPANVAIHIVNIIRNLKDLTVRKDVICLSVTQHNILRECAMAVMRLLLFVVSVWHSV